jgi:hypothetical protein
VMSSSSRPAVVAIAVMTSCAPLTDSPASALVEKQRGAVGAGPVGAFVQPAREGGERLGVDRDLAELLALADDPQDARARRQAHVVGVKDDDLGDPGAGVERDQRDRAIAR